MEDIIVKNSKVAHYEPRHCVYGTSLRIFEFRMEKYTYIKLLRKNH